MLQRFGGSWTEEKLGIVEAYLREYVKILPGRGLRFAYIDAFAGTGYSDLPVSDLDPEHLLFEELSDSDTRAFLEGSAIRALRIEPSFNKYIFIEKSEAKIEQLRSRINALNIDSSKIEYRPGDCNKILQEICKKDWGKHRAVLFLDPFGMQVNWETVCAIARTKAIDLWILFPCGAGVNRMLPANGNVSPSWANRLNLVFGDDGWRNAFYQSDPQQDLFAQQDTIQKSANPESIGLYYNRKLSTIFAGVARNPRAMRNSRDYVMYQLMFAASNPNAVSPAVKIAEHLLRQIK
ncbi:MAG: hypothetical protein AMXMBFR84_48780 [Candidatus Hydrogenedentota bacterium]